MRMAKFAKPKFFVLYSSDTTAKMSSLNKSRKAHDSKRIITYNMDEAVQELSHHFVRVFSDVLSDDVALANVKFQRYDPTFEDYEDLENDAELIGLCLCLHFPFLREIGPSKVII